MAGRAASVLVVLLALLSLGLALASAKDCVKADVVVEGREEKVVFEKNETLPQNATSASLYVRLGGGKLTVCVMVDNGTIEEDQCFKNPAGRRKQTITAWELMTVEAQVVERVFAERYRLQYNLTLDGRSQTFRETYKSGDIARLTVSAIGASEWLHQAPPDTCSDVESTSASQSNPVLVSVLVVVVVVGVLLLAVVVVACTWKRLKTHLEAEDPVRNMDSQRLQDTHNEEDVGV